MGWFLFFIFLVFLWSLLSTQKKNKKEQALLKATQEADLSHSKTQKSDKTDIAVTLVFNDHQKDQYLKSANNRWESENDDDLATVVIPSKRYSREPPRIKKSGSPGKWIKPGDIIEIQNRKIMKGFFYFGESLKSSNGFYTEPSLVDPSLEVSYSTNRAGDNIDYWPSYARLSRGERATYLDWLASDRDNTFFGLSYVFIYFYGLERRIVIDSQKGEVTDSEFKEIFYEVKRLNKLYEHNFSFNRHSVNLMIVMSLLRPKVVFIQEIGSSQFHPLLFKIQLSNAVTQGLPISAELAYDWLVRFSEYRLLTPAQRCNEEFRKLFAIELFKKFPEGLILKPNKTALKVDNTYASMGLTDVRIDFGFMPDITALKSPINNQLRPLADACTEMLDAYSRYLGREGNLATDFNALMLLPEVLLDNNPQIQNLKNLLSTELADSNGLISVVKLWSLLGLNKPERINKKEIELLQSVCRVLGYGYAPDERYHGVRAKPDENLVLYKTNGVETFEPSIKFQEMAISLRLGALVALTDDELDDSERNYLRGLISNSNYLNESEKESLNAYLQWRLSSQSTLAGLKSRVEKLGNKEIESIRSVIINVILADGESSSDEIKQAEKIYRVLGLDASLVIKDIHEFSTSTIRRISTSQEMISQGIAIDHVALAQYKVETQHVQNMLQEIFTEDIEGAVVDIAADEDNDMVSLPEENSLISGLDTLHFKLYQRIVGRDVWSQEEMVALEKEFNIMINGAIEVINDWAFELVDAPVIEGSDPYYIDLEIVEEIEEKRV